MNPRLAIICAIMLSVLPTAFAAQGFAPTDYKFLDDTVAGEVDVRADVAVPDAWPAGANARIVFSHLDAANYMYVDLAASGVRLGKVMAGKQTVLAGPTAWPHPPTAGVYKLTIMRRDLPIRVLCDGQTLLKAYDLFSPGEQIGSAAKGIEVKDISAQPIGEMMFQDDFARPPGEPNPWQTLLGTWETHLPETRNKVSDPTRAANPFSYVATGDKALAATGPRFWDAYQVATAVKTGAEGAVGLACYVQDADNYYVLRAHVPAAASPTPPGTLELVAVRGGVEKVLAEKPAALEPGKWFQLGLHADDGTLEGLLDGTVICQAQDETFSEGGIGLYTDKCAKAYFDDVTLSPYRVYTDAYTPKAKLPVDQVSGYWLVNQSRICGRPDRASHTGMGLTGSPTWRDYVFSTEMQSTSATGAGLYFGWTSPTDYYMFRWGPDQAKPTRTIQELWAVAGGKSTLLDSKQTPLNRGKRYLVEVTADRSYLAVRVDGELALEGVDITRPSTGRVGYHVEGNPQGVAAFTNLHVAFCEPPTEPVSIVEQFAKEDTMADWARPVASWRALGDRLYSYKLPVWGDFELRMRLGRLVGHAGSVGLRLAPTDDALAQTQACVQFVAEQDKPDLKAIVPDAAGPVDLGSAQSAEEEPLLEVVRRGGTVHAMLDGKPFAALKTPAGAAAPMVALKLDGLGINLNDATLSSPNIIDRSFAGAPTEWRPQDGTWDISDRWNCQPQWSWFCGRGAQAPLLWSKRAFSGDMVFEFWAGMMMDLPGGPGYSHPSDINGIICGDGQNLCSGYAIVLAGDSNTRSKIMRMGQTVAETDAVRFANPIAGGDLNQFHRHWFHCRIEKTGGHLAYYVDDVLALQYDDPEPLAGGQVGFWTFQNNGMLIARTRVAFH